MSLKSLDGSQEGTPLCLASLVASAGRPKICLHLHLHLETRLQSLKLTAGRPFFPRRKSSPSHEEPVSLPSGTRPVSLAVLSD